MKVKKIWRLIAKKGASSTITVEYEHQPTPEDVSKFIVDTKSVGREIEEKVIWKSEIE